MTKSSEITVLDHKVKLIQPEEGFRTSMDAVLLAAACPAKEQENILDIGCGIGSASFCLLHREPKTKLLGIDIQEDYIHIAQKNASLNNVTHQCEFAHQSITDLNPDAPGDRFDHVICNPPFYESGQHLASPHQKIAKARGHQENSLNLKTWIDCAFLNLTPKGSFTLIHQASKTDEILRNLGNRFGNTDIFPIYTKSNEPAKRVIIRSFRDRRSPCTLHKGILLEDESGTPTTEANSLLREGMSFDTLLKKG